LHISFTAIVKVARRTPSLVSSLLVVILFFLPDPTARAQPISHVIHVSVDGLRPDVITALGPTNLPNFYRMRAEGAFTDNARSDYDITETLQNHTTELTGRSVVGATGHNWIEDWDPYPSQTLASNNGSYVAGVYDVAHDNGLRTGHYASKSKFSLFDTSWNDTNGAPDLIGPDNGRDKIDVYLYQDDTAVLENAMITSMTDQPFHYVFLHLRDPDTTGHGSGWIVTPTTSDYCASIKTMDTRLGQIFSLIDTNAELHGQTAIVLTADHGGTETGGHWDETLAANYTVPFYVWGPGVMPGTDLYLLNPGNRLDPGTSRPTYSEPVRPIRNGEAANVALNLLQLGPVPGSTICAAQDLVLTVPSPSDFQLAITGGDVVVSFSMRANVLYDIQRTADLRSGAWSNAATNLSGTNGLIAHVVVGAVGDPPQLYRLKLHF
jgi:hypothetical protein